MLWTAVALMQRTEPDVVNVVYSGDVDASKDEIIQKVKVRVSVVATSDCTYRGIVKIRH